METSVASENDPIPLSLIQRVVALGSLALLLVGTYVVVEPFLIPILWAAILVYATWPIYRRLCGYLPGRPVTTSLVMTTGLIVLLFGPVILISLNLAAEAQAVVQTLQALGKEEATPVLDLLARVPLVGETLARRVQGLIESPEALQATMVELAQRSSGFLQGLAGDAARNVVKVGITLLTVFFLYLHGDAIVAQTRRAADYLGGTGLWRYMAPITQAVNAVLYGLILTALAQGLLAGLAYAVAGVPMPALLGAATAILALLPFGAPLIWAPAGIILVFQDQWAAGIGVLLWGMLVVSWIDNLIRPMVISVGTRIPFLMVFFGVIGGAMAFGLIGLFLGPIILSVLLTVWREWTEKVA